MISPEIDLSQAAHAAFPNDELNLSPMLGIDPNEARLAFTTMKGNAAYLAIAGENPYGTGGDRDGVNVAYLLGRVAGPFSGVTVFAAEPKTHSLAKVAEAAVRSEEAIVRAGAAYLQAGRMIRTAHKRVHVPHVPLDDLAVYPIDSQMQAVFLPPVRFAPKGSERPIQIPQRLGLLRNELHELEVPGPQRDTLLKNFANGIRNKPQR